MSTRGVTVLYFAWLKERVGVGEELVELPAGIGTVGVLADWLAARSPRHAEAFAARATIRAAVNQDFATPDTPVSPGDEVAFFPPVTGG
ncbi:MAG TPA: molybdopterin converting factor subunit 1 [Acidisphaera sp.]|nr:molybdopterin converting factor subunit 1 [Acidisphaera sp.]